MSYICRGTRYSTNTAIYIKKYFGNNEPLPDHSEVENNSQNVDINYEPLPNPSNHYSSFHKLNQTFKLMSTEQPIPKPTAIIEADKVITPLGNPIFIKKITSTGYYADKDYYTTANVLADKPIHSIIDLPIEKQLTAKDLSEAVKGITPNLLITPTGNKILLAFYYGSKTISLGIAQKDNPDFEDNSIAVVVGQGSEVNNVKIGDIISFSPGAGIRLMTKDFMDRDLHHYIAKEYKNKDLENLYARSTYVINRVMLRSFLIIDNHDVICLRNDS